jgi:hypothetical protein
MTGLSSLARVIGLRDANEPFDRLVRFNWRGQFIFIFALMLASFLVAGFWYPFWRVADMDFWVVYNALLLNANLPQLYFDHPGYLPILLLSYWLRVLHGIGLIRVDSLSALPPADNFGAFSVAWMQATQAGRALSLLLAMGFVAAFTYLLRALVRDWRVAALGGFLLAFSGGMAMEMRTMRTELLAAGLFIIALLLLLVVARRGQWSWRPAVIGLASALITLGMQSKVQLFFLICALPILLLPFGPQPARSTMERGFWQTPRRAWPALMAFVAITALATYLAKDIVFLGFSDMNDAGAPFLALSVSARVYWTLVTVWLGLGMIAYAIVWRVTASEALSSMLACLAGCMFGLLTLYARYNPHNVVVVFHPLETLLAWAALSEPRIPSGTSLLSVAGVQYLLHAIAGTIERRTFFLQPSSRPTIFVEWFVIAATVIAIRRREWRLVLQVGVLILTDWGIDTLGMARQLEQGYFLFTDPLAIIAAALLIVQLNDLQRHRLTYPIGVALITITIVLSQVEPVKRLFSTVGPNVLCVQHPRFPRLAAFPFCPPLQTQPH